MVSPRVTFGNSADKKYEVRIMRAVEANQPSYEVWERNLERHYVEIIFTSTEDTDIAREEHKWY